MCDVVWTACLLGHLPGLALKVDGQVWTHCNTVYMQQVVHIAAALERPAVGFANTTPVAAEQRCTQHCFKLVLLLQMVTGSVLIARWCARIGMRPGNFRSWQNPRGQDAREDSVEMDLLVQFQSGHSRMTQMECQGLLKLITATYKTGTQHTLEEWGELALQPSDICQRLDPLASTFPSPFFPPL